MPRHPRNVEQHLELVLDRIHEVPYGEGTWESALTVLADFLGAECIDISVMNRDFSQCLRVEQVRIDMQAMDLYMRTYMGNEVDVLDVHPRVIVAASMTQNEIVADADCWDWQQRDRMTFFREFYVSKVRCGECLLGRTTGPDSERQIMLSPHFRSRDPQSRKTRNRVRMLLPHVRRAVIAEESLRHVRKERDALADALDQVSDAVALLDRGGRVVRANRRAEAAFGRDKGLDTAADGRLLLATADARTALAHALAQCASPLLWTPGAGAQPPVQIAAPRREGRPLLLRLQPLPKELSGAFGAVAMLFINDPDAVLDDRTAALRASYGLSAAEARLMQNLAEGLRLKEIAARHKVTYETVRSQLRRVMEKTGTRRQSDLIRLSHRLR